MFNFGKAIKLLKEGHKVSRSEWNGMFIYLVKGTVISIDKLRNEASKHVTPERGMGSDAYINSHIDMFAADGHIVVGWLASQADMLSNDWEVVKDA